MKKRTLDCTERDLRRTVQDALDSYPSLRGEIVNVCYDDAFTDMDRWHYILLAVSKLNPELSEAMSQHRFTATKMVKLVLFELKDRYPCYAS